MPAITASPVGGKVAHSVEIEDLVIADYDKSGGVLGIEFVDARTHLGDIEKYVKLATLNLTAPSAPSDTDPAPTV